MARAITDTINKALRDGMNAGLAKAVLVALYKGGGDRADPSLYRGIAMQNLVPKILATLLSARLSHWAEWHGLIWPEQIGFKHLCGSEYHVMALLETLKARAQSYLSTAVLFVDFYKAYDCVHPEAIWMVLTKMGVPLSLVNLLRAWGQMRRVSVRINGELSEPFSVETGVAQGDPLSPLLFNLFMQSLSGWLGSRPDLHGARVNGNMRTAMGPVWDTVIKRLFYADDLAVPAATAAELQCVLDYTKTWADAWGMRINCGAGKTEAILFSRSGKAARPPPLICNGAPVKFVDSYVYLGRTLWFDMRSGATDYIGPIVANFAKRFTYNTAMRRAAVSSQLQMLKTCVLGAANYLRGVELLRDSDLTHIDGYTKQAARALLGFPRGVSDTLTWALSGLLTARGTNAREMQRVHLQLQHTPHNTLDVVQVVASTSMRMATPIARRGVAFKPNHLTSWVHCHKMTLDRETALGAATVQPACYADIPRAALTFGRSVSYLEAQRAVRSDMPDGGDTASLPPPSRGSARHAAWLLAYMAASVHDLGEQRQTPLSILGPGCSGSLHALADNGIFRAVANATRGDEALHCPPFAESRRKPRDKDGEHATRDGDDSDPEGEVLDSAAYSARFERSPCVLCKAAENSIFHLITSCPHPQMHDARAALRATLPSIIASITRDCEEATGGTARVSNTAATPAEAAALSRAADQRRGAVTPDDDDWRMLTYRILMGVPWPREPMARAGVYPAAAALGAVFDATTATPARLRRMASAWLLWSESQLRDTIARRWRLAQDLPPLSPRRW